MDILHPDLLHYAEVHSTAESALLKKINRDTHARVKLPRMLSGHLQGRLLSMISHLVRPKLVLEIGTYTGYSAICLAEGLQPGGRLITLDVNDELEDLTRSHLNASPQAGQIDFRIGNALELIPQLPGNFDLVFIDADKENYVRYYDLVIDRVRPGGVVLADNVLWSGKVLDDRPDKDTRAIQAFNQHVSGDSRVEHVLLPIRDGIMMMRKLSL